MLPQGYALTHSGREGAPVGLTNRATAGHFVARKSLTQCSASQGLEGDMGSLEGDVVSVFVGAGRTLGKCSKSRLEFAYDGVVGDRHRGN